MECPVCFTFDEEPKRLACTHTFCITCIKGILVYTRGKYKVTCPVCKSESNIPGGNVSKLQTNSLYHNVQQYSEDYCITEDQFVSCHFCKQSKSVVNIKYCSNCNWDLCITCSIKHTDKPVFHDHVIDSKSSIICRRHYCQFNFYCTFCDTLLCAICVNESICNGHYIKSLSELKLTKSHEMMKLIKELDITTRKSRFYRYEVKKAITLAGETKQILKQHVKHLNDLVNSHGKELLQSLSAFEYECNLYLEQINIKTKENQVYKELILSGREGMAKGIEDLVIMLKLMKSSTITSNEVVFPFK